MPGMTDDSRTKGKIKEAVGFVTGDRTVEAEGAAEAESGHKPTDAEREEKKDEVRAEHGDFGVPND